jgi:threonine aldolase
MHTMDAGSRLTPIDFRSDNVAPAAAAVLAALAELPQATAAPYGADEETAALPGVFTRAFGRPAVGWPIATGTGANAMAVAGLLPAGGTLFCHEGAHLLRNEEGAAAHAAPGLAIVPLPGPSGLLDPDALARAVAGVRGPAAVSLTQATERGTAYGLDQLAALAGIARRAGLRIHVDGARLGAACAGIAASPAAVIAASDADALSLGLTKAGGLGTDAVVCFAPGLPEGWTRTLRRSGLLQSKARYQSAQIRALMRDGLWLELSARAVRSARRLAEGLATAPGVEEVAPSASNLLLVRFAPPVREALAASRFLVRPWREAPWMRLVTSHVTSDADVDALLAWLAGGVAGPRA